MKPRELARAWVDAFNRATLRGHDSCVSSENALERGRATARGAAAWFKPS